MIATYLQRNHNLVIENEDNNIKIFYFEEIVFNVHNIETISSDNIPQIMLNSNLKLYSFLISYWPALMPSTLGFVHNIHLRYQVDVKLYCKCILIFVNSMQTRLCLGAS